MPNKLIKNESVETAEDFYFLVRGLKNIPRCHALPVQNRDSVAEHIVNTLFLADFCHSMGRISPAINIAELIQLKTYLQFHDVEETVMGDIPYHTAKRIESLHEETRELISERFGVQLSLYRKDIKDLAAQFDMLDFILSMIPEEGFNSFDNKRLVNIHAAAIDVMEKLVSKSRYKLDYKSILRKAQ